MKDNKRRTIGLEIFLKSSMLIASIDEVQEKSWLALSTQQQEGFMEIGDSVLAINDGAKSPSIIQLEKQAGTIHTLMDTVNRLNRSAMRLLQVRQEESMRMSDTASVLTKDIMDAEKVLAGEILV